LGSHRETAGYTALDDAGGFAIAIQIDQQPGGAVKVTIRIDRGPLQWLSDKRPAPVWVSPRGFIRRGDLREQIGIGGMPGNDCVQQGSSPAWARWLSAERWQGWYLFLPRVWLHVYDSLEPREPTRHNICFCVSSSAISYSCSTVERVGVSFEKLDKS